MTTPAAIRARAFEILADGFRALAEAERAAGVRDTYTTRTGEEPLEFAERHRAWLTVAPTIDGARRVGRWWLVPRAAYERWVDLQPAATPTTPANDPPRAWTPQDAANDLARRRTATR